MSQNHDTAKNVLGFASASKPFVGIIRKKKAKDAKQD